jgi:hypothetical protein
MGKRSNFDKVEKDYYPTPLAAVVPLVPFLPVGAFNFAEPCAGDGRLSRHVSTATGGRAKATFECDIDPQVDGMLQKNGLMVSELDMSMAHADMIITNPPWSRDKKSGYILHEMIEHFTTLRPTWLLFDSDWMQTKQATPYLDRLLAVVSVGRVKWIEDSKMSGKDNCQWHLFHAYARELSAAPMFFGRDQLPPKGFDKAYGGMALRAAA